MKEAQLRVRHYVENNYETMSNQYLRIRRFVNQARKAEALAREEQRVRGGRLIPRVSDDSPTKQVHNVSASLRNPGTVVLSSRTLGGKIRMRTLHMTRKTRRRCKRTSRLL